MEEHYRLIEQLNEGMSRLVEQTIEDKDIYEQLELFQLKFPTDREELVKHLTDFQKYSKKNSYISDHDAMRLFQITAVELWTMFPSVKTNKSHKIEFLEYLCCVYDKSVEELNQIAFTETIQASLLDVREACLLARELELELRALKEKEVHATKPTGHLMSSSIAARAAMFEKHAPPSSSRQVTDVERMEGFVVTAKQLEKESLERASRVIEEEISKINLEKHKHLAGEMAEKVMKEKLEQERRERDERKLAIKNKWEKPATGSTSGVRSAGNTSPTPSVKEEDAPGST